MRTLSLKLYPEGSSDGRFLSILIQKTAQHILDHYAHTTIEVLDVEIVRVKKQKGGRDILEAALDSVGLHILFVHKDADTVTYKERKIHSFDRGESLVQKSMQPICKIVIPVIPVKEMEAWILADPEKLRDVLEIKARLQNLGVPGKASQVESIPDAKATFNRIIAIAENERRREFSPDDLHDITKT